MNRYRSAGSLICSLVLGLPLRHAQAADPTLPPPDAAVLSCEKMMDQAMTMLLKMPAGVDKTTAQKELVSAKVASDRGDMAGCETHANNAIGVMTAHNPG